MSVVDLAPRSSGKGGIILSEKSRQYVRKGLLTPQDMMRAWFADRLYEAFPADSMTGVSEIASAALAKRGLSKCSARQVRYWLSCQHDASFPVVMAVLSIIGKPERVAEIIYLQEAA